MPNANLEDGETRSKRVRMYVRIIRNKQATGRWSPRHDVLQNMPATRNCINITNTHFSSSNFFFGSIRNHRRWENFFTISPPVRRQWMAPPLPPKSTRPSQCQTHTSSMLHPACSPLLCIPFLCTPYTSTRDKTTDCTRRH